MTLVDTIKRAALDALDASRPVHFLFGEIATVSPLSVRIDQRLTLPSEFLITTAATEELKTEIGGVEYVIRPGLQPGDKVLLARVQGGQQYIVINRMVDS
ncbi:DUF2577 domain-containing protein [Paenibacillus sinopodophylli]|uniref:DUF2577 domain-containing protein n=1 Tax=Paenibacillus sinopodophylli TaxID=1837342 RepID=UPI00110D1295|nr:DUF2577 domain-containing protein [Paenibacillus sinopodophylli]